MDNERATTTGITWAPLHPDLDEWHSFWSDRNATQVILRAEEHPDGTAPCITHLLVLGHDIRTADLQDIRLWRILQMIHTTSPTIPATDQIVDRDVRALTWIETLEPEPRPADQSSPTPGRPRSPAPGHGRGRDVDAFYRAVAAAYRAHSAHTSAVAPAIADEADVPVGTARTWIREARRRGHLPPAKSATRTQPTPTTGTDR